MIDFDTYIKMGEPGGKEWWNSRKFTLTWVRCE